MINIDFKTYGLNASFGARCFLTKTDYATAAEALTSLNAPFGAQCFLTKKLYGNGVGYK